VPLICPTCQNVFAGSLKASMPATTMLLCMGLFFDILVESESRVGLAAVFPVDDRRMACRAVAREPRARLLWETRGAGNELVPATSCTVLQTPRCPS